MNVVNELYKENIQDIETFKRHPGIRRSLEDLYPDTAHFIYELLQILKIQKRQK